MQINAGSAALRVAFDNTGDTLCFHLASERAFLQADNA